MIWGAPPLQVPKFLGLQNPWPTRSIQSSPPSDVGRHRIQQTIRIQKCRPKALVLTLRRGSGSVIGIFGGFRVFLQ